MASWELPSGLRCQKWRDLLISDIIKKIDFFSEQNFQQMCRSSFLPSLCMSLAKSTDLHICWESLYEVFEVNFFKKIARIFILYQKWEDLFIFGNVVHWGVPMKPQTKATSKSTKIWQYNTSDFWPLHMKTVICRSNHTREAWECLHCLLLTMRRRVSRRAH